MSQANAPVLQALHDVVDTASATTVFGTPITQDGITVLPVARVSGGGGGGGGSQPAAEGKEAAGSGAGIGLAAKPLGVYVIRRGRVRWRPAVDVNRAILGGQIVAGLLLMRAILRRRRNR